MTDTNKKKMNKKTSITLIAFRLIFALLQRTNTKLAGWLALKLWIKTHRFATPQREMRWLESANVSEVEHEFGPITVYHWPHTNKDAPRVLLIHGWNGRGGQLGGFVEPLLSLGFQVISLDAPGHGKSAGKESNLLRYAAVIHTISDLFGPFDSIIGHSFGAMAMARVARDGLNIRKAVAISSPITVDYLTDLYCEALNISGKSKDNMLERVKHKLGDDIYEQVSAINNVKYLSIPGLIVHDKHDKEIPVQHAQALNQAWSGSKLLLTEKLGHLRILRNKTVINKVVKFIADED